MVAVLTPCSWLASYVLLCELDLGDNDCDEGDPINWENEPLDFTAWLPEGVWLSPGGSA